MEHLSYVMSYLCCGQNNPGSWFFRPMQYWQLVPLRRWDQYNQINLTVYPFQVMKRKEPREQNTAHLYQPVMLN